MLLKYLPRVIPSFPVILKNQTDIFRAEQSGDLSFGMLNEPGQPQLPLKTRYLASLVGEHLDSSGQQNLFFMLKEKTSYPSSPQRLAFRQDSWEKLNNALQQLRSMDDQSSALLRYMRSAMNSKQEQVADLEGSARIELINLVLHQWNKKISIDTRYLACLDIFVRAKEHLLRTMLFPNRAKFAKAKKYMESRVENDPVLYHHAWSIGISLWNGIKKLRAEIAKPQFKEMLANSDWSPAAFLIQHDIPVNRQFRVTARKTNLGGVLSYSVPRGRLVLFNNRDAEDARGLFLGVCSANNFVMDLLTLLIDYACPGLRKLPKEENCPYKEIIQRPLYSEQASKNSISLTITQTGFIKRTAKVCSFFPCCPNYPRRYF